LKKYGYRASSVTHGTLYSAPNSFGDKDYRDIVSIYACPVENYNDKNTENIINISTFPSPVTKEEFDKLKEDVTEMKKMEERKQVVIKSLTIESFSKMMKKNMH